MDIECSLVVQRTPHYQKGHGLQISLDGVFFSSLSLSLSLLDVFPKQVPREGATLLAFSLKIA